MYALWMFFGDQFKEVYSPDTGTWTTQVLIDSTESGFPTDLIFPMRSLEDYDSQEYYGLQEYYGMQRNYDSQSYIFISPPANWLWADKNNGAERSLRLDTPYTFVNKNNKILVELKNIDHEDQKFVKYEIKPGTISIGRSDRCNIVDPNESVSSVHGYLNPRSANLAEYTDQSSNGTFLNGRKITKTTVQVHFGDMLMLPSGTKLVFLGNILAVNAKTQLTRVSLSVAPFNAPQPRDSTNELPSLYVQYHRAPRMLIRREEQNIEIGLDEYIEGDGACLIEWPRFIRPLIPDEHLTITISNAGGNERELSFESFGDRYDELLNSIKEAL